MTNGDIETSFFRIDFILKFRIVGHLPVISGNFRWRRRWIRLCWSLRQRETHSINQPSLIFRQSSNIFLRYHLISISISKLEKPCRELSRIQNKSLSNVFSFFFSTDNVRNAYDSSFDTIHQWDFSLFNSRQAKKSISIHVHSATGYSFTYWTIYSMD